MFSFHKAKLIKEYNSLRENSNHARFCNAPFTSIRFHRNGGVQCCCHHIDYQFLQEKTLKDIWFGKDFQTLRDQMNSYDIPKSCNFCSVPFYAKDFSNVNALSFDYLEINENLYPVLMDFSLENTCNLSCIMCDTSLSSKIQEQKNFIPKTKQFNYDSNFIEQITEFIPYLKYTVFTGGEPFLIKIYYDIWEKMLEINPDIIINITTNGTIFNQRINDFLEKAKVNITISVDSFVPDIYKQIRVGAVLSKTLENVYKFAEICHNKNTIFTITVCPMQINAFEIPEILKKCNASKWNFNFNTVLKPWHLALWSLDNEGIQSIIDFYKSVYIEEEDDVSKNNKIKFLSLISLLENWQLRMKQYKEQTKNKLGIENFRNRIINLFLDFLKEADNNYTEKVLTVVAGIPDLLIRKQFVTYIENISPKMIINEFEENDSDTIIDHMCIVAFNL